MMRCSYALYRRVPKFRGSRTTLSSGKSSCTEYIPYRTTHRSGNRVLSCRCGLDTDASASSLGQYNAIHAEAVCIDIASRKMDWFCFSDYSIYLFSIAVEITTTIKAVATTKVEKVVATIRVARATIPAIPCWPTCGGLRRRGSIRGIWFCYHQYPGGIHGVLL